VDNIFCFEETEKFGLRKGIVFYFDDWIEQTSWPSRSALLPNFIAVSLLWVPVPISCTDARGHTGRERMPVEHKRTAHQICKTEMLPADYPVRLPGVQMQIF